MLKKLEYLDKLFEKTKLFTDELRLYPITVLNSFSSPSPGVYELNFRVLGFQDFQGQIVVEDFTGEAFAYDIINFAPFDRDGLIELKNVQIIPPQNPTGVGLTIDVIFESDVNPSIINTVATEGLITLNLVPNSVNLSTTEIIPGEFKNDSYILKTVQNVDINKIYSYNAKENKKIFNLLYDNVNKVYLNPLTKKVINNNELQKFSIPFYSLKHSINSLIHDGTTTIDISLSEIENDIMRESDTGAYQSFRILGALKLSNKNNDLFDILPQEQNLISLKEIKSNGLKLVNNNIIVDHEKFNIGKNSIVIEFTYNDPDKYWLQNIKSNIQLNVLIIDNTELPSPD